MKTISIMENGIWAGDGEIVEGCIQDCSAVLGDGEDMAERAYEAIEDAIERGEDTARIDGYTWTWDIAELGDGES